MSIEQLLFEEAKELIENRYPKGWGGAAAMYTKSRKIYTSVAPEVINASTELCIETGSILEAHKEAEVITHSLCLVRDDESSAFKILTACGTCQERLLYWGRGVKVAVTSNYHDNIEFKTLEALQPYHWTHAYDDIEFEE